jgi:hypothetical protein
MKKKVDIIIDTTLSLESDPEVDKGSLLRALLFSVCLVVVNHNIPLEKIVNLLGKIHSKMKLALGQSSIFPPAES